MSDLIIHIRLMPKAARNAIQGWSTDGAGQRILKVSVTTVPEKGKANEALIALLSKSWKIPKQSLHITRGETDRNKTLLIKDIPANLRHTLENMHNPA